MGVIQTFEIYLKIWYHWAMKKQIIILLAVLFALSLLLTTGCNMKGTENGGDGGDDGDDGSTNIHYYVSPDGDDSNDGSIEAPWRTIQNGLNNLQPGQTLNIAAGTYSETLYLNRTATEGKTIFINGASAATTIVDGSNAERDLLFIENSAYISISGLTFANAPRAGLRLSHSDYVSITRCTFANNVRWGIFTDFSDYTTIEQCESYGAALEHGIYISNSSDNPVIRGNRVHHNYASGIQVNADPSMGDDGISLNCDIQNNLIYENGMGGGAAINLASVRDSLIVNNVIYHNYAGGIAAWDDDQGTQWGCKELAIYHNTVYFRDNQGRWAISLKNGCTDNEVYNNIMCGGLRGGFEYDDDSTTGSVIDYNVYYRNNSQNVISNEDSRDYTLAEWQLAGFDRNSVFAIPQALFVDETTGDLHLRSSAGAIDRALNVGLGYDFEGDERPARNGYDIGADEYK